MSLQSYLAAVPKAELHVHLEGSISPATLLVLAERNGIVLPSNTVEGLREYFRFRDFDHFIEVYGVISRCLKTEDDFELIAYEFGTEMARQNVRYAEVTFSCAFHHHHGIPDDAYMGGLLRGRDRARNDFGVHINWVFDIIRSVTDPALREKYADYTVSVAIENMSNGVVALGLGGGEVGYPPEMFVSHFERAIKAGLHSDPHAGEVAGPESVWGALRLLGAERIGHGVRSIEDPALVEYLAEHRVPLEVNPTSNVYLGVYPSLQAHPFRRLYEAGVPLTVNSDDPPLFNTTLNDEVALLASAFNFDISTIDDLLLNGIHHSFLPHERKQEMEQAFRREMAELKAAHLV
ncbi:MAG TPA: adenosine deaminase [Chloroflexia bacterium]|nr:adenosine deaminase [Chloroflexia bacterium]